MAWRKSLTALMRVTRSTQPVVKKTIVSSIVGSASPSVFRRMFSVNKPSGYSQTHHDEHNKELEMDKELHEQQMKLKNEKAIKELLFNTSQKILIGCVANLSFAHHIATTLGDASNITVMSQISCGEMKRLNEDARAHMLDLSKLGATVVFSVDFRNFAADRRVNHVLYDLFILDLPEK